MQYDRVRGDGAKKLLIAPWMTALYLFLFAGCVAVANNNSDTSEGKHATVFGLIHVETSGPNPQLFPTHLRFFDVMNAKTEERTRVIMGPHAKSFVVTLSPGDYEVIRLQLHAGPFMMESHLNFRFRVRPHHMNYLGSWRIQVDTPRTQRMVQVNISPEELDWMEILKQSDFLEDLPMSVSLPQPSKYHARLYVVAPYPKVSYFYR